MYVSNGAMPGMYVARNVTKFYIYMFESKFKFIVLAQSIAA